MPNADAIVAKEATAEVVTLTVDSTAASVTAYSGEVFVAR